MYEIRGVTKTFDVVVALRNAHLTIRPGEIQALLGSNGSGKSTMVKVLSGLVNPNSGDIVFDGQPATIKSSADARKLGVAVAYQDYSLIPALSVIDNIVLGLEPAGKFGTIDKKKAREIAQGYLTKLKIDCDPDALVQTLMPSTQSMIEIAKAIALQPKILILDEATASLHHDEVDRVFGVLQELKAQGMAIIIVTHRMGEVYRICDTCTILRGGETVAEGNIAEMDLDEVVFHMTGKRPDAVVQSVRTARDESGQPVLDVQNLSMLPKVRNISLRAYKGEIIGIGGLDGQGQSEFIRTLLADEHKDGGSIVYNGAETAFKSTADAIKSDIGFISGDRNRESIFPIRSVGENIYAGKIAKSKLLSPVTPKMVSAFSQSAMERYNIVAGSINHPASSLSGGNQQKLVVGRWLALAPNLLLLDDPTKGVDIGARREIHKILKQETDNGMCVIYVSSDNDELLEISDRIYVFYEGEISAELVGEDKVEEKLIAAMLGLTAAEAAEQVLSEEGTKKAASEQSGAKGGKTK